MSTRDPANPIRILIVDDHPNTATMLARVLTRFETPVEVVTAASGEDALAKVGDQMVDILITDFMMPGMNGLELIEKLKGEQKPAHTILITAYDTPGLAITARRLNIQDYLVKPVQPEKIRTIVARVIEELRPSAPSAPSAVSKRAFKIIVADDYPDNLRLLSTRLQNEGYTFIPAWDGEETLRKVREEEPDLVLLDVNMPKKDGFQVLAEMRSDPQIAHIPVIIITAARIGPKDVREGLTLGADDYVLKPFDWRELAARIHSKLRVKQAEDILRRRTKELGILPQIGQELSARLDIEELATIVTNRTVETLEAACARLDIFQPDGSVYCRQRRVEDHASETLAATIEEVKSWGLTDCVIASRKGVVVEDARQDQRWHGAGANTASVVAVPLLGRYDVIGVLTLIHGQAGHFTPDHQALLQAIASQAAIAIENAQLLNVEHRRVQEMVALNQLMQEINRFTHSRQLLESLPGLVQNSLGYPTVAVWDGAITSTDDLKLYNMVGDTQEAHADTIVSTPQQAVASNAPVLNSRPNESPSVVAVPLKINGRARGALSVYSPVSNAFQESDCVLLETLATQIVSALERIGLFESVEQEQRRLLAVLRSAADAILVIDGNLRLTLANPAGERLFTDADARVGRPFPDGGGYEPLLALLERGRNSASHQQGEVIWPDGRTFSVLVTPIEEGGLVAVLHDVSHFKALAEIKNEYIATASHDLKNPIMAVLGYNDLLAKAGTLTPLQEEFTRRIRASAMQMRDLVLNLLEISRLEAGMPIKPETLDLNILLDEIAQEFVDRLQAKGHILKFDLCPEAPLVTGDRTLLQQMAHNLLSNAIKYTPANGRLTIATHVESYRGAPYAVICFQDSGVGIPSADMPFIFNKFFRVHSDETKDIEGTGLGLAIVKSIVESHAGQIDVDSRYGEGTTFTVRLPAVHEAFPRGAWEREAD